MNPKTMSHSIGRRIAARKPGLPLVFIVAATLVLVIGAPASAHAEADAEMDTARVKYRQTLMDGVGADMGAISTILKNRIALPGHVESHARQLALSAKLISAAFKHESAGPPTDAKKKIWNDWSGFQGAIADFDKASNELAAVSASGDGKTLGPAVKALGKSCGGCHKAYRKPKEESFKNKK